MASIKQLSCQSSIEPCVVEEECGAQMDSDDKTNQNETIVVIEQDLNSTQNYTSNDSCCNNNNNCNEISSCNVKSRPDSLILNTTTIEDSASSLSTDAKKFLYRSQSTRSFKKPKPKPSKVLSTDLDQIYVISSNACARSDLNDFYDSIEVITERRSKNFMEFSKPDGGGDEDASCSAFKKHSTSNETVVVQVESHDDVTSN